MQSFVSERKPLRWVAALLLIVAGFVGGVIVTSGGGQSPGNIAEIIATPDAVASSHAAGTLSYADIAEMVMPAVVNISTDKVVESDWQHPYFDDPFFRRFFGPPREDSQERVERSLGSGIVISADGYVLTNNHVIEKASQIRVTFEGNEEFIAELIGTDPQTDVALIKIGADNLPHVKFGDSDGLRIADQVMAIGNPFGLGQTVTMGIVSALGRSIGLIDYEDLIQTDATINPGNSGGALVNMNGEVVGMNAAILSRSGGSQGIGFAIPSNMTTRVVSELREHGRVARAWLGVTIQPVDQSIADYYGQDKPEGVLISNVNEDTPADDAGLQEGDIVLSVDGEKVNSVSELRNTISLSPVGGVVKLDVLRDGKNKTVPVTLAELPAPEQLASNRNTYDEDAAGIEGVTVQNLSPLRRRETEIPENVEGVIVVNVEQRSNAAREGLEVGDVIVEVDKNSIESLAEYREIIDKGQEKPVLLRVYKPRTGGMIFLAVPR